MSFFVVTVKGEGLRATFAGAEMLCGFFKNEFVRAKTKHEAEAMARSNVLAALRQKNTVNQEELKNLTLSVDSTKPGRWFGGFFKQQGFVFHPMDQNSSRQ